MSHSPQKRPTITHRAVFSDHCYSLCGSTVAHTSAGSDPATGGRRKCRTPWISPCTVFKTGSETARIHLPYSLEVLHRAPSDSNSFGLETRTPLHLPGLPSPRFFYNHPLPCAARLYSTPEHRFFTIRSRCRTSFSSIVFASRRYPAHQKG